MTNRHGSVGGFLLEANGVLDRVEALDLSIGQVADSQIAPGADEDDGLAVDRRGRRLGGDRLRIAGTVSETDQQFRVVTGWRDGVVDVETPEVAEQIATVDRVGGVVGVGRHRMGADARQSARRRGAADTGADRPDQRTAIGVAALRDAEVLIFDEPTSGLDYKNMESVAGILSALSKRGKAILVISHDNELLMKICSRVIRVDERTSS